MRLRYKAWIEHKGNVVIGEGINELLNRVGQTGSIARAASAMGMAYREAWGRLRAAETAFGAPLLERHAGGRGGGGTALTPAAQKLLAAFAAVDEAMADFVAGLEEQHLKEI